MRFLFFTDGWTVGGMEAAFLSLMRGLLARGHQPTAIVSGWTDGEVPRLLAEAGIPHHEVALGRLYLSNPAFTWHTLRRMPAARRHLRAIAAAVRPDWVVSPDVQTLWLSASIVGGRRALFLQSPPERLMRHRWAGRLLDRRLDRVRCCSQFIGDCARSTPIDPAKLAVVPNGVPLPAATPIAQRTPVRLAIVGTKGGAFCDAVEARIAALGLVEQVRWRGYIADRDRLYGDLDILVAPAIDEPLGLTVAEAGAYGLPVVAAHSGAFPELIENGRTGLLFAPGDAADLARTLEPLVLEADLRHRFGAAGRERVASTFTIDAMTERFLEVCATSRRDRRSPP